MYENIGGKIKTLAKVMCAIGIVASVVIALKLFSVAEYSEELAGVGLVVMILGPVLSWVGSFVLYGFGQLVENSDIIAEQFYKEDEEDEIEDKVVKKAVEVTKTSIDDTEYIDIICPKCKEQLSYTKSELKETPVLHCPMCENYFENSSFSG